MSDNKDILAAESASTGANSQPLGGMADSKNIKVYVGMSGGVDSSLSAALLVEQGYNVTGVYMKNWTTDLPGMKCPWAEDLADAKRVAVQLGIDFKVFDFEAEYKQQVVDAMIEEYTLGFTPNPDVLCNERVKFKLFLEAALAEGADFVGTGHYARVSHDPIRLLRAEDDNKDQTYFLYRVSEEALRHTLFPIGDMRKPQVREEAEKRGLYTAQKKDSQGICFVGSVSLRDFLGQYVEAKPGDIVEVGTNKVLGQHEGALFYTVGQRHGLGIGGGDPYYVTRKDMDTNKVYVTSNKNCTHLTTDAVILQNPHWINGTPEPGTYLARNRHRATLVPATLHYQSGQYIVEYEERVPAIAAGQSVVLYQGEVCLGGGLVSRCF